MKKRQHKNSGMKIYFYFFSLFLFSINCFSQNIERYCFSSISSKMKARQEFQQFKLPSEERLKVNQDCFDLIIPKNSRVDFWNSFLSKRHGASNQTLKQFRPKECRIKIEKVSTGNDKEKTILVGRKVKLNKGLTRTNSREESFIRVSSGKKASLGFNEEELKFKCTYKNEGLYEIEFSQKLDEVKNFFYTINGIPFWQQVRTNKESLQTSVLLNKGQKIEVGRIQRNNDKNRNNLGIPSGIDFKKENGTLTQKIFLSIQ